jgi:hypothetical protein
VAVAANRDEAHVIAACIDALGDRFPGGCNAHQRLVLAPIVQVQCESAAPKGTVSDDLVWETGRQPRRAIIAYSSLVQAVNHYRVAAGEMAT